MTAYPQSTSGRIYIQEVCPRDGLQNESVFVKTQDKIRLVDQLSRCGFAKIEVTSFTSPKAIPALKDAETVMNGIRREPGVEYSVLVPNLQGAERAMACRIDEANLVMSASESHNATNLRMGREASFLQLSHFRTVSDNIINYSQVSGLSMAIQSLIINRH